jgi:UDPglucose 6-dehydrogenase
LNITVIGAGYVGLVTSACFAELGNRVTCVDFNEEKITLLKKGVLPIYEPGLESLVITNVQVQRLHFVAALAEQFMEPQVIFIAVGTPSDEEGAADTRYVLAAAKDIGAYLTQDCIIVTKSTVPVGMAEEITVIIQEELSRRQLELKFEVVSNPEFLREGAAIEDFMRPDRIIIGHSSDEAKKVMGDLYLPILRNPEKIFFMQVKDAEMTKYVANAMLATRISFMNEMALLCEQMGVDIENVRVGIGSDARIGNAFLHSGCGYGGSCFPKDVRALIKMAEQKALNPLLLDAVEKRNVLQKKVLAQKIKYLFGQQLENVNIGIWGLSFKPETDDMREASSLVLIEELIALGATLQAYDPIAMPMAKRILPGEWLASGKLSLVEQQYDVLNEADVLVLVTEWKPFCYPDFKRMQKLMRRPIIIDGRNQYDPYQIRAAGFEYYGIGRQ